MESQKTASCSDSNFVGVTSNQTDALSVNTFSVRKRDGHLVTFSIEKIKDNIKRLAQKCKEVIAVDQIAEEVVKTIYDGVTTKEIGTALVMATSLLIEKDPVYSYLAAQFQIQELFKEVLGRSITDDQRHTLYREAFVSNIIRGVDHNLFDKRLLEFDFEYLSHVMQPERDEHFEYIGIKTLCERYFCKDEEQRIELPQAFWMRVAMGLAIAEPNKNERAAEFYNAMSTLHYVPSTPTLLHAGLLRPQLSSCYLTTVTDDLHHIFKCFSDNAQMSKWSGGVANDWTQIRATGSVIKSIRVESQGVVPFLKIVNDTTAAINRSGKRRSATVVYLECWHYEVEDFLDLRRNTGDERRRTHDINTANWVPDLFMKRMLNDQKWTLFSPSDVLDLHELYGKAFETRYVEYEQMAARGEIPMYKEVQARDLWKKMLSRLFETGHPWITFKDACNVRSPQDHVGVVHSSNLCTEITLNTSSTETAVCNLGSVNLGRHVVDGKVDKEALAKTIKTALRMLDNVIDINFYPTVEGKNSNLKHRPVGLGMMGFQDALFKLDINFTDPEVVTFADNIAEFVSYHAILASSELAKEHGPYASYKGSKWDRGIFPVDTLELLEKERGIAIETNRTETLDWTPVREHVRKHGMRNSNTMAIAPTATIANISGCFPCIEPMYRNLYVKANMSGEFTVVNKYLVEDLKKLNLWNQDMLDLFKYYDGNIQKIEEIPQELKNKYREAFEVDPKWLVKITAARGKWIDQSQSHNVFLKGTSGKELSEIYVDGWKAGMKTFYYLRTLGASQIEKSTLDAKRFGFTQRREYDTLASDDKPATDVGNACKLIDPECDSCQ